MKIQGVISDMDGVILDSEKLYVRFWCEAGRFYGFPMEEKHALSIRSMARPLASAKLKGIFGDGFDYEAVRSKRVELMDNYVEKNGIEVKSGAKELLSFLKENGYKVALATATPPQRAERYLKAHDLYKYFDVTVSASMVSVGKPAHDIYLKAAEMLGLSPQNCVALEDSPNGIKSASSAGCVTVMVPDLDKPSNDIIPLLHGVADGLSDVKRILRELEDCNIQ